MIYAVVFGGIVVGLAAMMYIALKLGKSKAKREQADINLKEMSHDNKIASKPNIDHPASRMRPKS